MSRLLSPERARAPLGQMDMDNVTWAGVTVVRATRDDTPVSAGGSGGKGLTPSLRARDKLARVTLNKFCFRFVTGWDTRPAGRVWQGDDDINVVIASRVAFWDLSPEDRWDKLIRPIEDEYNRFRKNWGRPFVQRKYHVWCLTFPAFRSGWNPIAGLTVDLATRSLVLLIDNGPSDGMPWALYHSGIYNILHKFKTTYTVETKKLPTSVNSPADDADSTEVLVEDLKAGYIPVMLDSLEARYPALYSVDPSEADKAITARHQAEDRQSIADRSEGSESMDFDTVLACVLASAPEARERGISKLAPFCTPTPSTADKAIESLNDFSFAFITAAHKYAGKSASGGAGAPQ